MASLSSINIRFNADLKGFSSQMQNVDRQLKKTGRRLQRLGTSLSVGVTLPLTALGAASVAAFDKQAKAIAQVEQGLLSTGNAVGKTSDELQKLASELQNNTLFGDEAILKDVTAQLLTFTNIAGNQFNRTQQAALDLATRLDGDLKSASIQLGKALNDPIANLSALSRSGIQFSNDQKALIKSLWETGRAAEAQTIILDELEKQYGGSAAAAAKAGTGPLTQLKNILGDITEEFGKIIVDAINPFVEKIKGVALRFQELSPTTKKWLVILGGVAAAIGPLLALAGTILPAIATGLTILTGPIGLIIAGLTAVGVVIYKNWKPIKKTLIDIANYFIDLYNESTVFRIGVEAVVATFKTFWEIGKFVFEGLESLISAFVSNFTNQFKTFGKLFKAVLTGNFEEIPAIIKQAGKQGFDNFKELTNNLSNDWTNLLDGIEKVTNDGLANITTRKKLAYLKDNVDASGITEAVADATIKGLTEGVKGGTGTGLGESLDDIEIIDLDDLDAALDNVGQRLDDAIANAENNGFLTNLRDKNKEDLDSMDADMDIAIENLNTKLDRMQEIGEAVGYSIAGVFNNLAGSIVESLGLASSGFEGFVKGLVSTITKLISMMLAQSLSQAIAGATASGTATGPAAIFTTPAFIAQAISGVLAAFAAIPKFETGGIVGGSSFTGDRLLARVNSGEMILNQRQQQNLSSMLQPVEIGDTILMGNWKLTGDEIQMVLDRAGKKRDRRS